MGHDDHAGREPVRNESLADRYERERAGVSGDPSPDRTYGDEEDKPFGQSSERWRKELKDTITAIVFREGKASAGEIASELLLYDVAYIQSGREKRRLPTEVVELYAEEIDKLYQTPEGEWVAGE